MNLPITLDLNRIEMPSAATVLEAIIPAATLAAAIGYFYPAMVASYFSVSFLGYGTKLAVAALAAYTAGFILAVATEAVLGLVAAVVLHALKRIAGRRLGTPAWQSPVFRKVAGRWLGAFAPADELPMSDEVYTLELRKCELSQDPLEAVQGKLDVLRERSSGLVPNFETRV